MPDPLVSIVIPAYNPTTFLLDAIASAASQNHPHTEIILVNDGSDQPESAAILHSASQLVSTYLEQANRGLGAARNAGFDAARGEFMVPLDADDLLEPSYIGECLAALTDSNAAFAYADFEVFGTTHFQERPGEYNLYRLLDRNYLTYAALIRKQDWEACGGYDETGKCLGYEDWEFWLKLGGRGRFGRYVRKPLFRYRKHGPSLYDAARARHQEFVDYIQSRHPELFAYENRARIKAQWSPAVSIIARTPPTQQTIEDIQVIAPGEDALSSTLLNAIEHVLEPEAAELAALATWSGRKKPLDGKEAGSEGGTLHRHLVNAGLLSIEAWTHHPIRSAARLIPLRLKERVNRVAGRPMFDLSFYLQFQPNSVLFGDSVIEPLVYFPKPASARKRVALVTTQLGPGGAEAVLYDIASTLCADEFEVLLFATQS
ncbi:MAG TPA: glycosyltransferase family A protein, partial [Bryobacteraceae bacterium]|nr:glycosyltransferase family A protein [Bryobacteraceae bacterium]